eukprot:SAG22_NODE_3270_length_1817_cov_1.432480_1_plen_57_part_10
MRCLPSVGLSVCLSACPGQAETLETSSPPCVLPPDSCPGLTIVCPGETTQGTRCGTS